MNPLLFAIEKKSLYFPFYGEHTFVEERCTRNPSSSYKIGKDPPLAKMKWSLISIDITPFLKQELICIPNLGTNNISKLFINSTYYKNKKWITIKKQFLIQERRIYRQSNIAQ